MTSVRKVHDKREEVIDGTRLLGSDAGDDDA